MKKKKKPKAMGRISIPVVIDDVKNFESFQMTRCTYFSIQCDTPAPNCYLGLGERQIPFLMLGLSGILFQPSLEDQFFDTPEKLEELFQAIEELTDVYVDINDIWLPNFVFTSVEHTRGSVYRIGIELFEAAYHFRNEVISNRKFSEVCDRLVDTVHYSPEETEALRQWEDQQIEMAKTHYKENPERRLQRSVKTMEV